jgi:hypothetical protein
MMRKPLVMFPNGALMRCEEVPPEGILVIEPELPEESDYPAVIDQTQAVREAEYGNGQGT